MHFPRALRAFRWSLLNCHRLLSGAEKPLRCGRVVVFLGVLPVFLLCWFLVSVLFLVVFGPRRAQSSRRSGSAGSAPVPPAVSRPAAAPACSLAVRAAVVPSSCCLLLSRSGRPLSGGALAARVGRLRRSGVLV
ncbi:hypothetical protein [Picosynechococcus sp. PCC 7117]|uniref:hypothetical protein n=1 Tax=Picosynechococcus sp. PCC 7117 TaxID=195498 RepID=UPI0012EDB612|nr:hypothetical protein [Picosynechococcus sp. PCC 7117]